MKNRKVKKLGISMLVFSMVCTGMAGTISPIFAVENTPTADSVTADGYNVIGELKGADVVSNEVHLTFTTGEKMQMTFISSSIFRMYLAPQGESFKEFPTPNRSDHKATMIQDLDTNLADGTKPKLKKESGKTSISTDALTLEIDNDTSMMALKQADGKIVWEESAPLKYTSDSTVQTLKTTKDEYFYGGGTQNGRFSHKGKIINIKNESNWVDQGVASPNPFYWSTKGYGVVRNTFRPGEYNFGATDGDTVTTSHKEKRFDAYYFVGDTPADILKEYYTLTGTPVELPEYASYLGHLNCYNRDYWLEASESTRGAVKIGDKYYVESQTNNGGEKETLLGTGDLSAEKIIQEHKKKDMPLGWFLPNDGYGCGYGQASTQEGDIQNLKEFATYAKSNGIHTGLWTQSDLWPKDPANPKKGERDIYKEVQVGVEAVKTDVAWVGSGYSMALNGVSVAYDAIASKAGIKPNIVSLDGWAGTQRYAGIWSGDQTGGKWEYIRFHIPTYIGTGLSGQPNIGSDMDGIFGGGNSVVNTRDFQWKAFTTYMLDMDGWGANQKSPWALGEDSTSINRAYLKLKAQLQPYINTVSHEATSEGGLPMLRAMFLEEANSYTYGTATQYQYMWGDSFLVAPIYQDTAADKDGNDVRNDIYLPSTSDTWIDYFTGKQYRGGQVVNGFDAPIWKLPVFVKNGAILPRYAENNNSEAVSPTNTDGLDRSQRIVEFFPYGETSFTHYEDDGITLKGDSATTKFTSKVVGTTATLTAEKTDGSFSGMVKNRSTEFMVHVSKEPTDVTGYTKVNTKEAYESARGKVYFYEEAPSIFVKGFATENTTYADTNETTTPILYIKDATKMDITSAAFKAVIEGFENDGELGNYSEIHTLNAPDNFKEEDTTPTSITLTWDAVAGAEYYEIEFNGATQEKGTILGSIEGNEYTHIDLSYATDYTYRIRAVTIDGYSPWSALLEVKTADDPYRNVPNVSVAWDYGDRWGVKKNAFDHSVHTMFHSSNPVTRDQMMELDLGKSYKLDRFEYIPRNDNKGNGTVKKMDIYASQDGNHWQKVYDGNTNPEWKYDTADSTNLDIKTVDLSGVTARYLKLSVLSSAGGYFSAAEMTVYNVDGDKGRIVGDTNNSGRIEENDLTFYENYVGLKKIDNDWVYVNSLGNFNLNDTIDAYDVAFVARQVGEKPVTTLSAKEEGVEGKIMLLPSKTDIKKGDNVTVEVYGFGLKNVYAFNIDFAADKSNATFQNAIPTSKTAVMKNYSMVRTHTGNSSENIVFFSNTGEQKLINGTGTLAKVSFTAEKDFTWSEDISIAMLVGKDLSTTDAKVDGDITPVAPTTKKILKPGDGIDSITFSNAGLGAGVESDGSTIWQQPKWKELLFDGETTGSMAEFKWNPTTEVMLPTDFNFTLDGERYIENITIYGRQGNTNGTVKTSKLVAYNGEDKVFDSEEPKGILATFGTTDSPMYAINQKVTKIVWTPLTSFGGKDNRMLSLHEIEIQEDLKEAVKSIKMNEDTPSSMYVGSYISLGATVSPSNATNPFYELTSSDETIAKVIKMPTPAGYVYALQGVREGTVTITATALGDDTKFVETQIEVLLGVDTSALENELVKAKAILKDSVLYTKSSITDIQKVVDKAENFLTNPTSSAEADKIAFELKVAVEAAIYLGSKVDAEASKDRINQKQMTVVSATNHADKDVKENSIDGNKNTCWHSSYQPSNTLPVDIVVDLGAVYELEQIDYLPRQANANGHITKYRVEVSTDGESFSPVVVGTFAHDGTILDAYEVAKQIKFDATTARYVKLIALETLGSTKNKYASIAELNFYGTLSDEENTPVSGIVFEKAEIKVNIGDTITDFKPEILPSGAKANITYSSSNEKVVTVNATTGEIRALGMGTATITAMVNVGISPLRDSDPNQYIATYDVIVGYTTPGEIESRYEELTKIYEAIKENDYNSDILNEIKDALLIVADGIDNTSVSQEDIKEAGDLLTMIETYIQAISDVDSINELIKVDLSKYDTSTTANFKTAKTKAEDILEDALANIDDVSSTLAALQTAYNNMRVLNSSQLQAIIAETEKIDLDEYLDGAKKEAFKTALTNAEDAVANATTNAAYESASTALKEASKALVSMKKASNDSVKQIEEDRNALQNALDNNRYSDANTTIIKDAITNAKNALDSVSFTQSEAEQVMSLLNKVLNTTAREVIVFSIEENTSSINGNTNSSGVNTGDILNGTGYLVSIVLSACVILVMIMKKKNKENN